MIAFKSIGQIETNERVIYIYGLTPDEFKLVGEGVAK
jgi:hypothetical protein